LYQALVGAFVSGIIYRSAAKRCTFLLQRLSRLTISLSILTAIYPGEPRLAGFIEAKDNGGGATTGAIRCAKPQSYRHYQQANTQLFYRPDALKGK